MHTLIKALLLTFCLAQTAFAGKEIIFSVVSLDQATKIIIKGNKNKVLSAKSEVKDGKKIHVIKILSQDGRVQSLKVDADTGRVFK
jgi:uncharacterized membrane protein YkoI